MRTWNLIPIILFAVIFQSCNTTEPPARNALELKIEDASSTDVWLRLNKINTTQSIPVSIKRNGKEMYSFSLANNDTVLKDSWLSPNKNYTYQVVNLSSGEVVTATAATMDTTNHQLNWQTFTFGGGNFSGSYFNDVAIIDENNIWAVGAVYTKDSLGNDDPTPYNAAHWNGKNWELNKIYFPTICEQTNLSSYPASSIFAFGDGQIWVSSSGDKIAILKGGIQVNKFCLPWSFSINKIWGTSSKIYIAGNNGNILFYNGTRWQKIESGTEIRLIDIYGTPDGKTIWACGWDYDHPGSTILQIQNQTVKEIWNGLSNFGEYVFTVNSVWSARSEFWTAGVFVFRQSTLFADKGHLVRYPLGNGFKLFEPGNYILSLRGTDYNNVYAAGDWGMLWHFNGSSWHKYDELYNTEFDRRVNSIAVKENLVVAVGWKNSDAWIAVGKK